MQKAVASRLRPFMFASVMTAAALVCVPALALSEMKPTTPGASDEAAPSGPVLPGDGQLPMPGALIDNGASSGTAATSGEDGGEPVTSEISHDISKLPEPVRRMRQLIVEAAASGDISRLRPLLNPGPNQVQISGDEGQDPLEALKSFSGDPEGLEVLAIILDLLSTGYAHLDAGTPEDVYVWPYFAGKPLAELTAPEKVELLRIITAGDLADMQEYGNYSFYRIGITPSGEWKFFSAGD